MLNQSGQSSSTMGKCTPMQAIIARTLESVNCKETKMFLLTDKTFVSKLEFIRICYGGFIIPLIFCIYHMPFAQNTVIMSGLVLLAATWKCNNNVSHKNRYLRVLVLHLLPLLNPWLIVINCMIFLSLFLDIIRMSNVNSSFPWTVKLWNSLPIE